MKILFRMLMSLLMTLALLLLASCTGAPGCPQAGFGSSTACGPGGPGSFGNGGGGGGGGGGSTPAAFVYAVDQIGGTTGTGANGTIDGYDLSTSAGTFVALKNFTAPQIPANDPGVAMVVVNKQYLYAIFQLTEKIYGYSINSTNGGLTLLSGFPLTQAFDINNAAYNQYNVTTDPGGNFLFVSATNVSPAAIYVYSIDSTTGALTQVTGSPFSTPNTFSTPGGLTTDGLGKYLYVCESFGDHNGGAIMAYSLNSTTGFLTPLTGSPFTFSSIPGMWQLQGDASGRYLVGTSAESAAILGVDDDHLYVFSIQQTGANAGAITQASGSPIKTTYPPFTIAMQPPSSNGEFVYSFSVTDTATGYNPIEGFSLDPNTGALTELTGSPFSNLPTSPWGQFDQSGSNLLVYTTNNTDSIDELLFISGTQTELIPLSVSSSGTLTQPISAATLVTEGWWTITDP
jgi:6-phosphogluconolactonase